mgnify:CR=1 FL=1
MERRATQQKMTSLARIDNNKAITKVFPYFSYRTTTGERREGEGTEATGRNSDFYDLKNSIDKGLSNTKKQEASSHDN